MQYIRAAFRLSRKHKTDDPQSGLFLRIAQLAVQQYPQASGLTGVAFRLIRSDPRSLTRIHIYTHSTRVRCRLPSQNKRAPQETQPEKSRETYQVRKSGAVVLELVWNTPFTPQIDHDLDHLLRSSSSDRSDRS